MKTYQIFDYEGLREREGKFYASRVVKRRKVKLSNKLTSEYLFDKLQKADYVSKFAELKDFSYKEEGQKIKLYYREQPMGKLEEVGA